MKNPFSKFENFGAICDFETRKNIAEAIFKKLLSGDTKPDSRSIGFSNIEMENFSTSIDEILSNELLKELTENDHELAESITLEILNFIHKTKRLINASGNPFESEINLLNNFSETEKMNSKVNWKITNKFLKENYTKEEINPLFYTKQFNKSFETEVVENDKQSYQSIRNHLSEKWKELILLKLNKLQQQTIKDLQREFSDELDERLREIKDYKGMMQLFSDDFVGIFDMPASGMDKDKFEVLKKYSDIVARDMAVRELVNMLGKMRRAISEEEIETLGAKEFKGEWTAKHASKADLIGVRESDDLHSMLPSETALLSDPALQMLFFKKYTEKKLQTFEFENREKIFDVNDDKNGNQKGKNLAKGPFIICVDTSGSMRGMPELIAKTICLAILKIAFKENRNCYLITFSTNIATLNMTDLKNSMDKIVDFLSMSFHGGTDASPALYEAIRMLGTTEFDKADVK